MSNDITNHSNGATLTENELFQRFLKSKLRIEPASSLVEPRESAFTVEQNIYMNFYPEGSFWPLNLADDFLEHMREADSPEDELSTAIDGLREMEDQLRHLLREFAALREATQVEIPDEGASLEVLRDWEVNPRYVLPKSIPTESKKTSEMC